MALFSVGLTWQLFKRGMTVPFSTMVGGGVPTAGLEICLKVRGGQERYVVDSVEFHGDGRFGRSFCRGCYAVYVSSVSGTKGG